MSSPRRALAQSKIKLRSESLVPHQTTVHFYRQGKEVMFSDPSEPSVPHLIGVKLDYSLTTHEKNIAPDRSLFLPRKARIPVSCFFPESEYSIVTHRNTIDVPVSISVKSKSKSKKSFKIKKNSRGD